MSSDDAGPTRATDRAYLRAEQYRDAGNFSARVALRARFGSNRHGWSRWVFDHLPARHGAVLEVGCGPGILWRANRDRLDPGWQLFLSDFSPGMLAAARAGLAGAPARVHLLVSDAQILPFASRRFDCVIANHMLYHVADRAAALREVARVLRPGGSLIASTVGHGHMAELDDVLRAAGAPPALAAVTDGPFTMENGAAQLARVFAAVERDDYADELLVTEVQPLLDYVRSMGNRNRLTPAVIDHLRAAAERAIGDSGAFRIRTASGLFVARQAA